MSFTSPSSYAPRWRDVYLVAAARAISYCGDFLAATTLALTLQTGGDNGVGVAALLVASALPVALLGPVAGRLADRFDSRTLLIATSAAQASVCLGLAFTSHALTMIALVTVISAGLAITQPTMAALVPDMVGRDDLPRAMSISQTAGAAGMLLGPALGGLLVGSYGTRLPLLLDAASYLALAGAAMLIHTRRGGATQRESTQRESTQRESTQRESTQGESTQGEATQGAATQRGAARGEAAQGAATQRGAARGEAAQGGAAHGEANQPRAGQPDADGQIAAPSTDQMDAPGWRLRDDRLLVTLFGAFAAVIAAVTAVNVAEIFFVRETLGSSATMYGLVSATWTLGLLLGAWPWGKTSGADRSLVTISLFLLAAVSAVVLISATVTSAWWLLPLYLLGGLLNAGLNVLAGVVVSRRAPGRLRGRVFGLFIAVNNAANMAGFVLGGALITTFTPRSVIAGTGIAGILVAAAFLIPVATRVQAARAKGTQAKGTQAKGTHAKGIQAKGTQAKGTQAKGIQAKGTQAKAARAKADRAEAAQGTSS